MFSYEDYKDLLNRFELKYAPENLFLEGDISLLTNERRVCVVGSRNASQNGLNRAKSISKYLCEQGITVVSGLAQGIDTIAHETAIIYGRTVAVLGTPLNISYPKENSSLLDKIKANHLAISQFPTGYPTNPKNFPIRNRTMALISDATIIVEASESSGTKHQGWEALRIGRKLYIMENVMNISWAKEMINYGAIVLTRDNYQELIEEIPLRCFSNELMELL
ncbi:DNA-processing protein DprA [Runella limosa]|uniref:DNA-processing protein DprA n=1 Tax=Runella limosa TaxID=370978 RepID=UPI00055FB34E|nr:DNA-processing protein DprA [Runella limosa]